MLLVIQTSLFPELSAQTILDLEIIIIRNAGNPSAIQYNRFYCKCQMSENIYLNLEIKKNMWQTARLSFIF